MTKRVDVSDHALLRYLERALGLDLDAIRAEMLTPVTVDAIRAGATSIRIGGVRMPVSQSEHQAVVVTVLPKKRKRAKLNYVRKQHQGREEERGL